MSGGTETLARVDLACSVVGRRQVATDVVLVDVAAADGAELPAWAPGAHVELEVAPGLLRQYSLCGDPDDRSTYRVAVLREPGGRGGSVAVHDVWEVGTSVRVTDVRNHFAWAEAEEYVLVAGGIGVTPILPMVEAAARAGRPWRLHYTGSAAERMAFRDELVERHGSLVQLYGREDGRRLDAAAVLATAGPGAAVYVCGPASLIDDVRAAAADRGLVAHRELFSAEGVDLPSGGVEAFETFEVEFARSGVTVTVGPGESILELGEQAGADVFGSCYEGICGTCETTVLSGEPVHRDAVLDEPGDSMMICVSRAACPRLVLDA